MPRQAFRSFEIHIHTPSTAGTYPVTVHVPDDALRADGVFCPPYSDTEINLALNWMEQGLFDRDYVKEFGARLFDALFTGAIKQVYTASRHSRESVVSYRLIIDAPAVARIPWELLYDPEHGKFLALEGSIVRDVSLIEPTRPLKVNPPLRLLVIDAFPRGVPRVENQLETTGIEQALSGLTRRGKIEIKRLPAVTLAKLQNELREAKQAGQPFHLLHFIGHGQFDPHTGRTVLLFEDEQHQIDEVEAEALVNVLHGYNLSLVFLNACQSMQSSALDITRGFAPALLASGVPAVIGMQVTVLDKMAVEVSRRFYEALADNRPVDAALRDVRPLLRGTPQRRQADMGIPVCYLRPESGQLLDVPLAGQPPLTRQNWPNWLATQAARPKAWLNLLIFLVITAVPTFIFYREWISREWLPPEPEKMEGVFNVAVADFGMLTDSSGGAGRESEDGHWLAQQIFEELENQFSRDDSGVKVGHENIRFIQGATPLERNEAAANLAEKIDADVVIYGYLAEAGGSAVNLVPMVYVRERMTGADELGGSNAFGNPIGGLRVPLDSSDAPNKAAAEAIIHAQIIPRFRALALFMRGLAMFKAGEEGNAVLFDEVLKKLTEARKEPGAWSGNQAPEILDLWIGSTILERARKGSGTDQLSCPVRESEQLGDWDCARAVYEKIQTDSPDFSRAYIGLGNWYLDRAEYLIQHRQVVDCPSFSKAISQYEQSLKTASQAEPTAYVELKAHYSIGLAAATAFQNNCDDQDYYALAESHLSRAIETARSNPESSLARKIEVNASYKLGNLYFGQAETTGDSEVWQRAIIAFKGYTDGAYGNKPFVSMADANCKLSQAYQQTGQKTVADEFLKQCLAAAEKVTGPFETGQSGLDDADVAYTYYIVGLSHERFGALGEAQFNYEQALAIAGIGQDLADKIQARLQASGTP